MATPAGVRTALIVVDFQVGVDDPRFGPRSTPEAEANVARLLAAWRTQGRPIVHVQHMSVEPDSPLRPGLPGNAIKPEARPLPGEPLFQKSTSSAFVGTALEPHLRELGVTDLVLVGTNTDHCVSATARSATDLGFRTVVVSDATATFGRTAPDGAWFEADLMHRTALASLDQESATIRSTADLLAE